MADIALAGRVIASHYAEPLDRKLVRIEILRAAPFEGSPEIGELFVGEPFAVVDESLGWAWGYAGKDRRVGYVRSEAIG